MFIQSTLPDGQLVIAFKELGEPSALTPSRPPQPKGQPAANKVGASSGPTVGKGCKRAAGRTGCLRKGCLGSLSDNENDYQIIWKFNRNSEREEGGAQRIRFDKWTVKRPIWLSTSFLPRAPYQGETF